MSPANRIPVAVVAVVCLASIACNRDRIEVIQEDPAFERSGLSTAKVAERATRSPPMRDHFNRSTDLLQAIVRGDLEAARRHSTSLAQHQEREGLASWAPQVAALQAVAQQGIVAKDIKSASQALARIGVSCANCHTLAKRAPRFVEVPRPAIEPDSTARMRLHQWAAYRMWEGLLGPSDERWRRGLAALAVAPLHSEEILNRVRSAPDVVAQAQVVHNLSNEGAIASSAAARADVFARFVENCASCHRRVGLRR